MVLVAACGGRSAGIPSTTSVSTQAELGTADGQRDLAARDDGRFPQAALIDVDGTLYGTTEYGGKYGAGTVFSITTSGVEKVLLNFGESPNGGKFPVAPLLALRGTLYGTTTAGGTYGGGTVFSVTPAGAKKIVHSFGSAGDGIDPRGGLIAVRGKLYGTTWSGGTAMGGMCPALDQGCGTVFSITTSGVEKVLHSFGKGFDGWHPAAGLVSVGHVLYGATFYGGTHKKCDEAGFRAGCGTVFSITPSGVETVLHNFQNIGTRHDGEYPRAPLLVVNGDLYGTTIGGRLQGTVFVVTTDGAENTLYNFGKKRGDVITPEAGLIEVNGTLYGTTSNGNYYPGGIFSITTAGVEKVLYRFVGGHDGATPVASLVEVRGVLYGTTQYGGDICLSKKKSRDGCGTVFSVTTSGQEKVLHEFR